MEHKKAQKYIITRLEEELSSELYYHNLAHTLDVIKVADHAGRIEGIEEEELEIIKTAAAFHDSGFLEQYNDNEEIACEFARQSLPGFDYPEQRIDEVCSLIMATRHNIDPRNLKEQVLCDADFDYLGRKDYKRIASSLYKELAEHGYVYNEREWITMQINFLSNKHKYYTQTAQSSRQNMKMRHVERLKEKLV